MAPDLRRGCRVLAVLAAAALIAPLAPSGAQAAPFVDVTYDLSDSSADTFIALLGVTVEVPPNGTIHGTQTIRYAGGSGSYTGTAGTGPTLATGAAELISFNLYVHATVTSQGYLGTVYLNTNDLHFEFLGLTASAPSVGQRLSGGTVTPLGASGRFRVTGTLHCTSLCNAFRMSASQTEYLRPQSFTAPLPRLTGAVDQPHTVKGTASDITFIVKPDPSINGIYVYGTTFLVGREISRTAVPEPGTLPLLAAGVFSLGLAGAAARWRTHAR